jgi:NAD(P)H dehydrogenase (quinone)
MTIAVTGSSGLIGGAVAWLLADAGAEVRPLTRAHGAYEETDRLAASLAGAQTVFLVSGGESANRLAGHYSAVEAIVRSGARHIVYLSFFGAAADCAFTLGRDHFHTEQRIRETGLGFTFLRDNFYQSMVPAFADASGVIRGPADGGRLSAVHNADVAEAAAAVLLDPARHAGATYDLTGPDARTMPELADALARASGRPVTFVDETVDEAYASRARYGAPAFLVDGWVSTYIAIAKGEVDAVSPDVERLTGHPARTLEQYFADYPQTLKSLAS